MMLKPAYRPQNTGERQAQGLFPDLAWESHMLISWSTLRGLENGISLIFFGTPLTRSD